MSKVTVRDAIRAGIAEEMERDPSVFIMGEEVAQYDGAYKVTKSLLEKFGSKRVIDTPISEYGFTGICLGASMYGLRPIVEFMNICFSLQAIDHIVSTAAKNLYMTNGKIKNPMVFRGPNGWSVGIAAQHAQDLTSMYAAIPGLRVLAPWSSQDAKSMIKAAIRDDNPVMFLESETLYGKQFELDTSEEIADLNLAKVEKTGSDITVIGYSASMNVIMDAAEDLKGQIDVEVINLRSVRPIDMNTILKSLSKTNNILVVQNTTPDCSVGSTIIQNVCHEGFDLLDSEPTVMSSLNGPVPYGPVLEDLYLPKKEHIIQKIKYLVGRD